MELFVHIIGPFHTLENGKAAVDLHPLQFKKVLHLHKIIWALKSFVVIAGLTERYGSNYLWSCFQEVFAVQDGILPSVLLTLLLKIGKKVIFSKSIPQEEIEGKSDLKGITYTYSTPSCCAALPHSSCHHLNNSLSFEQLCFLACIRNLLAADCYINAPAYYSSPLRGIVKYSLIKVLSVRQVDLRVPGECL